MASTAAPIPLTRSAWVDDRLKAAILSGELGPGEKLVAAPLAARWSVSPTPLREAFQRLAAEGFVEITPQRGARVASVSARDAEELYELRRLLEPRALRESLERSDATHRAEIRAGYDVFVSPAPDVATALARHRAFHATLLARCPSRWLLRITEQLAEHTQRYQLLAIGVPGGHRDVESEHAPLCDAAVTGDVDRAVALLEDHLDHTLAGVRTVAAT
ncbi:MAG: GntR family transcriptional regulator [Acidimicrobiia bacterium]